MRTLFAVLAAGVLVLLGGCVAVPAPPAAYYDGGPYAAPYYAQPYYSPPAYYSGIGVYGGGWRGRPWRGGARGGSGGSRHHH